MKVLRSKIRVMSSSIVSFELPGRHGLPDFEMTNQIARTRVAHHSMPSRSSLLSYDSLVRLDKQRQTQKLAKAMQNGKFTPTRQTCVLHRYSFRSHDLDFTS